VTQPFLIGYRDFGQGGPRPYLVMHVTGINGRSGRLWGLVDSGADRTSMPFGFATLMGYGPQDLTVQQGLGAGGTFTCYVAHALSTAIVPEIPGPVVSFAPMFVQGSKTVLWGRTDFMSRFDVTILERSSQFSITPAP
jgi:hypothetical protein